MMRAFILVLFVSIHASAQILTPAKLKVGLSKDNVKVGDEIELVITATIDKNWYMYSTDFDVDCGPIPFSINLAESNGIELVGKLRATNHHTKFDKIFECDVNYFENKAEWRQSIKIVSANARVAGLYEGQVCTETDGKCIPVDDEFTLTSLKVAGGNNSAIPKEETKDEAKEQTEQSTPPLGENTLDIQNESSTSFNGPVLDRSILDGESPLGEESFFGYLVFAFILGLTSLITPCVFPMIPMTVSFFLRDNQSRKEGIRKAIIFGLSIITIYTLAGTLFAVVLGAEGLNALATHWAPNLFVSLIFLVFALSFFGLFEINAPNALLNRVDQQADKGGLFGVFFMAATLVLVSFSCTIPIVGNVVVLAAGGQILKPVMAMFSYALAFAIPFTLFAFFPEWIKKLPKSGGWLNSVKVTLGFIELALCLKFFSIADQAYHWGLLDRDVNIAIWIVVFTMMGFYFLGKIQMKADSPVERVTVPRLLLATLTFSFVIYLAPGLWGAPLKMLAGYLPPMYTHDFDLLASAKAAGNDQCEEPKYDEFLHLPHGLNGYFDYKQALACARTLNKPVFIDFTGHGCTNCREMEAVVWSNPQVLQRLQNDYVVVALYVDDKTELPEADWYTSVYDNKVKKTIGKQNADLQIRNLDNNAQPFYVLLGEDERVLAWPYGYDRSVDNFVKFLDSGSKKFKQLYN